MKPFQQFTTEAIFKHKLPEKLELNKKYVLNKKDIMGVEEWWMLTKMWFQWNSRMSRHETMVTLQCVTRERKNTSDINIRDLNRWVTAQK